FSSNGTYTSAIYDAGTTVALNSLLVDFAQPSQTTLQFQVASAAAVNGSCTNANFVFVGPDGTSNTKFSGNGMIPLTGPSGYVNPGRCIRYKAFFNTSDSTQTPTLYDIAINYSL